MGASIPEGLLVEPNSEAEAMRWLSQVVDWVGSGFDPSSSFADLEIRAGSDVEQLVRAHATELDRLLAKVNEVLGPRLEDLAYREVLAWPAQHDRDRCRAGTAPPPSMSRLPRWWLVERDQQPETSPDPTTGLAYEDEDGVWWIWEPATSKVHAASGWIHTDYYFRAEARRGEWVDTDVGPLRFTALTPDDARRLIATNAVVGVTDPELLADRHADEHARSPEELLRRGMP